MNCARGLKGRICRVLTEVSFVSACVIHCNWIFFMQRTRQRSWGTGSSVLKNFSYCGDFLSKCVQSNSLLEGYGRNLELKIWSEKSSFLNILKTKFSLQYFVIFLVNMNSKSEFEDIFEKPLKFFLQNDQNIEFGHEL